MSTAESFTESTKPYPLSENDIIVFDGNKASFSGEAAKNIKDAISKMSINLSEIARTVFTLDQTIRLTHLHIWQALRDNPAPKHLPKHSLLILLRSLETRGVITLPAGEALEIFLEKPIEPYLLSDGDIILCSGNTASFSEDAAARIVDKLKEMGVTQTKIESDAELSSGSARLILKKKPLKPIRKEGFYDFLHALIANGVIKLPEGQERQPLSTYPLSDGDIVFKGKKVSLSKTAAETIQDYIEQNQLEQTIIDELYTRNNLLTHSLPLNLKTTYYKQTFANILMVLMQHGVIQLKDQDLGKLLFPEAESSCTPTPETLNITESCAAVGGGEIPALTALLQPSTQHT